MPSKVTAKKPATATTKPTDPRNVETARRLLAALAPRLDQAQRSDLLDALELMHHQPSKTAARKHAKAITDEVPQ